MKGKKSKKLKIPIYFGDLKIIQVKSLKELNKKYDVDLHGYEGACLSTHTDNGYPMYVLAFESKTTAGVIAHEACHLVNRIFDDTGIKLDSENDEPQCYLLGWIVSECHKFLKIK